MKTSDRYSKSMKRFNEAMTRSQKSGFMFDFSDAVRGFAQGSNKIELFKDVLKTFMGMLSAITPVIQNVSNAFSGMFVRNIKFAINVICSFC